MLTIEQINDHELKFIGRFDASQEKMAADELSKMSSTVTIDMEQLNYISSMGLSVLVNTYKRLHETGNTLRLKNINSHVRDVFKYTRLDQIFEIIEG
ncbi:MAG: STAS domain-containing protein [Balneolaceae bacterium]|nr:STAS domain-containing protein [Balneolaceae bacterium]